MIVTPEQLHLATQYPYDPPHESFLFVNGRALQIVDCGRDPLVDAQVQMADRIVRAADALAELGAVDTPGMEARTPVLSYGSNTSPFGIDRKYARMYDQGPVVIPAIACDLDGHDVVFSPHFSCWGTIPATIAASSQTKVRLIVLYLAPAQLELMNDVERGPPPAREGNYVFGCLTGIGLQLDGGATLSEVPTYVSHYGILALDAQPVALTAINAGGRRHPGMTGAELLVRVQQDLAVSLPRKEFLAQLIADIDFRRACTARLAERALSIDLPGFVVESV